MNLRDLGGMTFATGKGIVPDGLYLRSGKLSILSRKECRSLCKEYNIKCVIDLRTPLAFVEGGLCWHHPRDGVRPYDHHPKLAKAA